MRGPEPSLESPREIEPRRRLRNERKIAYAGGVDLESRMRTQRKKAVQEYSKRLVENIG